MLGALLVGQILTFAQMYPDYVYNALLRVVSKKMAYMEEGTTTAWFRIVVPACSATR